MIAKTRRPTPNRNVAVPESELLYRVGSPEAAEMERRRQTQRHGDDRIVEIALILVLVKREARARPIAIDQTCVRAEPPITGFRRRGNRESNPALAAKDCPSPGRWGRNDIQSDP
jgi:hypothetical protein